MPQPLIILFADNQIILSSEGHKLSLLNWCYAMHRLNIDNYKIYCMEKEALNFVSSLGLNPEFIQLPNVNYVPNKQVNKAKNIWLTRLIKQRELIKQGQDFICSDLDAVWIKDARPILIKQDKDIIMSKDNMPKDLVKKYGFTGCCGLFGVRANKVMLDFFNKITDNYNLHTDDQKMINYYLDEANSFLDPNARPRADFVSRFNIIRCTHAEKNKNYKFKKNIKDIYALHGPPVKNLFIGRSNFKLEKREYNSIDEVFKDSNWKSRQDEKIIERNIKRQVENIYPFEN